MTKNFAAAALAAALIAASGFALAAAPAGFDAPAAAKAAPQGFPAVPGAPQGFEPAATTVKSIIQNAKDDQHVTLQGKFVRHVRSDKYEFVDAAGDAILAELDDDRDWSMIVKDKPVEIRAEVDRDWNGVELEVKAARALQ